MCSIIVIWLYMGNIKGDTRYIIETKSKRVKGNKITKRNKAFKYNYSQLINKVINICG